MLSKIFKTGQSFAQTCRYVCENQQRAEILEVEGVRSKDHILMAADFEWQHQLRPEKEKPVFHGVLSFPHGEQHSDDKLVKIARSYLKEIGMTHTQYAIVKHTDKAHLHMHIIANRVNNDGVIIGKGLIIERGIRAAEKLSLEYNLRPQDGKDLKETNFTALQPKDMYRYQLYQAIKEQLPACRSLADLEYRLLKQDITIRYKQDAATGKRQGISFRIGKYCFKGSQVDKTYSLRGLEQALSVKQQMVQSPAKTHAVRQPMRQHL